MSLTTPEQFKNNDIYSEEGFFLYWKSTSLLWEEIISTNVFQKYLIIPVNWAAHVVGNGLDFGEKKKDLNISRLVECGEKHGKTVVLLVSISPNPFLANGGIPSSLAVNNSMTNSGLVQHSFVNGDLIKIYSFFDTLIYKTFSKFTQELANSLKDHLGLFRVATAEYGSIESGDFNSYFNDNSSCFKKAFDQYLESLEEREKKIKKIGQMQKDFISFVKGLYFKEVHKRFSSNFLRHQLISVINTGEATNLTNLFSDVPSDSIGGQILDSYSNEIIPFTAGLNKSGRNDVYSTQVKQLVTADFIDRCFESFYEREESIDFLPMSLFSFVGKQSDVALEKWHKTGLISYLKAGYQRAYNLKLVELERLRDSYLLNKVLFVTVSSFSKRDFYILKELFHSGVQVVLDINGIEEDEGLFLKEFLSEKGIKKEVINIGVVLASYSLRNSTLILIDSDDFEEVSESRSELWKNIIKSFLINHLSNKKQASGIINCWRCRSAKPNEMNFDEVRRLSLYNMSDYKKEYSLKIQDGFYLLKSVDKKNVNMEKVNDQIIMSFHPKSSISLDFGVVYE